MDTGRKALRQPRARRNGWLTKSRQAPPQLFVERDGRVIHSIEIWREVLSTPARLVALAERVQDGELPAGVDGDGPVVVEVSRIYPTLSREIAEYLAR